MVSSSRARRSQCKHRVGCLVQYNRSVDAEWWDTAATVRWRTNGLRDELADQLLEVTAASFPGHDLCHLLTDLADLAALGVACALHLLNHTHLQ